MVALAVMLLAGCSGEYTASDNNNNDSGDCGNGVIDSQEQCDGSAMQGVTCEILGFTGGVLACDSVCQRDVSACDIPLGCGNGVLDPGEDCDGVNLGGQDCHGLGFDGGALTCSLACRFETAGCSSSGACGDGEVNPPAEDCDGSDLAGQTCQLLGYDSGTLACTEACQLNPDGCVTAAICGDGQLGPGEECDSTLFGGATCVSLGYDGGTLACNAACDFDTSGCTTDTCGDGVIDLGEECDTTNFGGVTCVSLGYTGGQLACSGTCRLDTTGCSSASEICTNGIDDNGNGQCDCLDAACATDAACLFTPVETNCGDGLDNDHDCLVDCADNDCQNSPACMGLLCSPFQSIGCGDVLQSTTVGGPTNFQNYPGTCAGAPDSGPEAYFLFSNAGGPFAVQATVTLTATNNQDLDLIVVGSTGSDCDVQGRCIDSSQTPGGNESVVITAATGAMYYIIVDGYNGAADAFSLSVSCQ